MAPVRATVVSMELTTMIVAGAYRNLGKRNPENWDTASQAVPGGWCA
jgi:hypothetical protein